MIVLVDPHSDDTVYEPLLYRILKKRPFKKYNYLHKALHQNGKIKLCFSYKVSSLPTRLSRFIPSFLMKLLVKFEIVLWKKINKIEFDTIDISQCANYRAFVFGKRKTQILNLITSSFKEVYLHLSHYHAFPLINQPERNNLFFCADNDISDFPYFKTKFPWYKNLPFYVVPFVVDDRFVMYNREKELKCCITGTYHDIPRNKIDFGIYNSNGNSTLHPLRFELSKYDHDLINKRLSLFGFKDPMAKQKDYFKFNIVNFYNQYKYALVPGEGNGLIAIGSLEALNCGCKIFLTPWEAKGLFDDTEYVSYDGSLKDFIKKLEFLINLNQSEPPRTISKFKKNELILRFKNTFSNND